MEGQHMKKESWLVMANSGIMKLFRFPNDSRKLTVAEVLSNPEQRLRNHEVNSDKEGRSFNRVGSKSSAYEHHIQHKEIHQEAFAKKVAHFLNEAAREKKFDRLYLAISKEFFGVLKGHLHRDVVEKIADQTHKDLIHETVDGIWSHFPSMK
jgi:protein required for attachment to host cells